jgi:hypothetical protein
VDEERLRANAIAVLAGNWTGGYTVPSRSIYPHQWSWDSGFIAVGLARYAPERAWRDLNSLFAAQWPDGRVPHIVFDPGVTERHYFPGPTFWAVQSPPGGSGRETSGIVQPPVHALAVAELVHATGADASRDELRRMYPRLVAQQRYLAERRDVGGAGLAAIVHPWESGMDNSPAWDTALSRVVPDLALLHRHGRRDLTTVSMAHRPTDDDYGRYLTLAARYRDGGYADDQLRPGYPFLVECPAFNAILGTAEHALAGLAPLVGADPQPHRDRAAAITRALVERLYDPRTGMFHALDLLTGERSPARCIAGLLPLILPDLPGDVAAALVAQARSDRFGLAERMALPPPSYDRTAPDFDPLRYWRGPVWINVNWLLWQGLVRHGYDELAAALRHSMLELVARHGCAEYFDPVAGTGIGSPEFSWTAALTLDLLAGRAVNGRPSAARPAPPGRPVHR